MSQWVCVGRKGQPHLVHVADPAARPMVALCGAKFERSLIECPVLSRCHTCEACNRRLT